MEPISGNVFAAEYILKDRKSKKGKVEYLIKWKGWNSRWNTWEPSENILDHRLLDEYKDRKTKSQSRNRGQKRSAKGSSQTSRAKSQRKATKQKKSLAEEQSSDEEEREQEEEGGGGKEEDQPGTSSQESGVDVSAEESVDNPEENAVESMGEEGIEEDKEKVEESEIPGGDSTDGESSRERLTQIVEPLKHSQLEPEEQQGQPPTNTDSASSLSARPPAPAHAAEDQDEQSSSSSSSEDSDSDDSEEEPGKSTLPPHTEIQQAPDTNSGPEDLSSAHRVQEFPLQGTPSPPHLSPLEANKVPQPAQVSAAGSDTAGPAELTSLSNVVEGSGGGGGGLKKVVCSPQELQFPNHSSQLVTDVEVQDRGKVTIVENLRGSV